MSFNTGNNGTYTDSLTMSVVGSGTPIWQPMPTTTLKESRVGPTLEVFLNILMLGMPERQLLGNLVRTVVVDRTHQLLRTTYAFDNTPFAPRGEHGPFERLTQRKMNEYVELSLRGKGVEYSWDRLVQNTSDLARIAFVLSERMLESNLYAAMGALARNEVNRLRKLNAGMFTPMLHHAFTMMSLNLQTPEQRNVRLSESSTLLDGAVKNLYLPPGAENMWGSKDGPMVFPVRGTLNDDLQSPFQQEISVGEYMRFPDFLDTPEFAGANQRDMFVYDHAMQTQVKLSFLDMAQRAVQDFVTKNRATTKVSGLPGFGNDVKSLYGRSKLVAARLPLVSEDFVLLLTLAKSKKTDWTGVTSTLVNPDAPQVGDDVARSIEGGKAIWTDMFEKFQAQSPSNKLLAGISVGTFFDAVKDGLKENLSIQNVAAYVGAEDSLADLDNLIQNQVNLPIDLIALRRQVQTAGALVIMTNGRPSVTVYTSRPLAGTTPDASNQTTVATVSFANGAVTEPDAVRNVMLVRGGIYVRHIAGGGVTAEEITPILVAPGQHINDFFPMTEFAAMKLTGSKVLPDVAKAIDQTAFFDESTDDLSKLLAETAVRSACVHRDKNGKRVLIKNPQAPAHLIAQLHE